MKKIVLKKVMGALVISGLIVALMGCGSQRTVATESGNNGQVTDNSSELHKVVIAVPGNDGTMMENALIAQSKGYFEEELKKIGYYPEYQGFPQAGPAVNEAYAAKQIDFAVYGDFPAITAKSNGVDIKIIGQANRQYNNALLVPEESEIKKVEDLKGKKVVIPIGTVHYKWFQEQLAKAGLTVNDVETINSVQDGPSMLQSKDADAIISAYQACAYYEQNGIGKIVEDSKGDINAAAQYLVTGRTEFIEKNPKVAEAILKALKDAYEFATSNDYNTVLKQLQTASNSEEVLKKVYEQGFSYFNPQITTEDISRLKQTVEYMKQNLLITKDVNIDDFVDTSYWENIK